VRLYGADNPDAMRGIYLKVDHEYSSEYIVRQIDWRTNSSQFARICSRSSECMLNSEVMRSSRLGSFISVARSSRFVKLIWNSPIQWCHSFC
jgi:hypothetical protein